MENLKLGALIGPRGRVTSKLQKLPHLSVTDEGISIFLKNNFPFKRTAYYSRQITSSIPNANIYRILKSLNIKQVPSFDKHLNSKGLDMESKRERHLSRNIALIFFFILHWLFNSILLEFNYLKYLKINYLGIARLCPLQGRTNCVREKMTVSRPY